MKRALLALAFGIFSGSMLAAAPLASSSTRTSPQDLEVFEIMPDGTHSASRFYSYKELETLPVVTVQTKQDAGTLQPATYTGIYISDLFPALGAKPDQNVIGSNCYDNYKDYYDPAYIQAHQPILLLRYDHKPPAQWPKVDNLPTGPYYIVHQDFVPTETICGYTEPPRYPFGVISLELTTTHQAFDSFTPKRNASEPEVLKGQRIAMGSCIMCHNTSVAGGTKASQPWMVLSILATSNGDYFRSYVVNPKKFNPNTAMPDHPTFDAKTLDALQAYFKSMM